MFLPKIQVNYVALPVGYLSNPDRFRVWNPPLPHVTEQADHEPYADHWPSKNIIIEGDYECEKLDL